VCLEFYLEASKMNGPWLTMGCSVIKKYVRKLQPDNMESEPNKIIIKVVGIIISAFCFALSLVFQIFCVPWPFLI
jgi:hypothetical protein